MRTEAHILIWILHPGKQATLNVTGPHPEYRELEEGGRAGSSGQKSRLLLSSRGLCPGSQSFGGLCSASSRMRRAAPRGNGIPEFQAARWARVPAGPPNLPKAEALPTDALGASLGSPEAGLSLWFPPPSQIPDDCSRISSYLWLLTPNWHFLKDRDSTLYLWCFKFCRLHLMCVLSCSVLSHSLWPHGP